jgi:hypothetical protein
MLKSFKEFSTSHDLFGAPIQLNFAKKDTEYKTFHGGIISIGIKCVILGYIGSLVLAMVTYDNNDDSSISKLLTDEEILHETLLSQTSMQFYLVISNYAKDPEKFQNMKRFIEI